MSGVNAYRCVLADRGLLRLLLFGVLARLPVTACGLALTWHIVLTLHRGFGAAGLVATAFTIGTAIGSTWRGHAVDRHGLRTALVPSVLVAGPALGLMAYLPFAAVIVSAFLAGLFALPVFTVIRQSLAAQVAPDLRRTAFSLDSIGVELSYMAGPAIATVAATQIGTRPALLGVALTTFLAGVGLWWFDPPVRAATSADPLVAPGPAQVAEPDNRRVLLTCALLLVLGAAFGSTLVLYGTEVCIVAVLKNWSMQSWGALVFFCWSLGSICGALCYGALPRGVHPAWLLLGLSLTTFPVAFAGTIPALCWWLFLAGGLCAPVISSSAEGVAALVSESRRGLAMGWHGSVLTLGGAVGAPITGLMIDARGPAAGLVLVATLGVVLAVLGLSLRAVHRARRRVPSEMTGR